MRKIFKVVGLLALVGMLVMPMAAAADGTVTVEGGVLSISDDSVVNFGSHPFADVVAAPYVHAWMPMTPDLREVDQTFTGLGWKILVSASTFAGGAGAPFSTTELKAGTPVVVKTSGQAPGVVGALCATTGCAINGTPLKVWNNGTTAVDQWNSWDLPTEWRITLPQNLAPGTYVSTWTFTISAGP